jgi:hypothetical protein
LQGIGKTAVTGLLRVQRVLLRNQRLPDEQVLHAEQSYVAGKSAAQVASELALPISSIYDALKRAGVPMRPVHESGRRG